MGLYDPAFATLTRLYGLAARAPITGITLIAGFASTIGWPASAWFEHAYGWREACFIWAGLNLVFAMPLNWLLGEVSQASKIGIVLLDSCRNNPFIERITRSMTVAGRAVATTPGLARVDNVPRNTMVVMAAKADKVAEDGGEHSPFAAALLVHLQIPGLELSLFVTAQVTDCAGVGGRTSYPG